MNRRRAIAACSLTLCRPTMLGASVIARYAAQAANAARINPTVAATYAPELRVWVTAAGRILR